MNNNNGTATSHYSDSWLQQPHYEGDSNMTAFVILALLAIICALGSVYSAVRIAHDLRGRCDSRQGFDALKQDPKMDKLNPRGLHCA